MVIFYCFNVLKNANVRPLVGQKGPYNPTNCYVCNRWKYSKKIDGSGVKLIIEQEDMNDIIKIIEALENSGILLKGVTNTIENETKEENENKEQRGGFLSMLLGTLGASLLGNLLTGGKGIVRAGDGIVRAGEGTVVSRAEGKGIVRAGEGSKKNP